MPTKVSDLTNDSGFIDNTYHDSTKQDVINDLSDIRTGAGKGNTAIQPSDLATVATSGDYEDLTNRPTLPTRLSDLTDDTTHRVVTDTEKTTWNNKSDFSGNYNDLTNKPAIPTVPTNVSSFVNDAGYLTSHQDISGKLDTSKVKNVNSTTAGDVYDVTYINTMLGDIETLLGGI